jgi:hypothetical protein
MLSRIRAGLTYSNVMSTIAVFVALGGGAAYAAEAWTGDDIQDETLTGADVRGAPPNNQQGFVDGTLETWDIKDGSIFPSDIADDTLGPSEIAPLSAGDLQGGSVGGGHVQDGSLGGADVANDSLDGNDIQNLNGSDIANDSLDGFDIQNLSGADIADGSVGPEDLAPGVGGFARVTTRNRVTRLDRGDRTNFSVTCPAGWIAVGGGYSHSATRDPDDFAVSYDERFGTNGWLVSGKHVGGAGARDITLRVSVNCVQ